jgi:hypothetical protein
MKPARLAKLIKERDPDRSRLRAMADFAGVHGRIVANAYAGRPVSADAYLRICGAFGLDPVAGAAVAPHKVGALEWGAVRLGFVLRRALNRQSLRAAAVRSGMSLPAVYRVENAEPVSPLNYLRACKYIGVPPWGYCRDTAFEMSHVKAAAKQRGKDRAKAA